MNQSVREVAALSDVPSADAEDTSPPEPAGDPEATRPPESGGEGAAALMQGMIGALAEVLDGLDQRLAELHNSLRQVATQAEAASTTARSELEEVASRVIDRVERLEVLSAGEGAPVEPAHAVIDAVTALDRRVDGIEQALDRALGDLWDRGEANASSMRDAVGRLEQRLGEPDDRPAAAPDPAVADAVQGVHDAVERLAARLEPGLQSELRDRMGALEERFDALADRPHAGGDPDLAVGRLTAIEQRLAEVAGRPEPEPGPDPELLSRLATIEQRLAEVADRPEPAPATDPELVTWLAGVEKRLAEVAARPDPGTAPELLSRLATIDQRLADVVDRPETERGTDPELLSRLDALATRMSNLADEVAGAAGQPAAGNGAFEERVAGLEERLVSEVARLAATVEQAGTRVDGLRGRLDAASLSTGERVDAVLRDHRSELLSSVAGAISAVEERLQSLEDTVRAAPGEEPRASVGVEIDAVRGDVGGVRREIEGVRDDLEGLRRELEQRAGVASGPEVTAHDPVSHDDLVARLAELVQRETELLTQRVAAVSMAVDSTRALLSAHVDEAANTVGRKATEVGRRLAADFGFGGKKRSRGERPELGRGPSRR